MVSKADVVDMAMKLFEDYDKDNSGSLDRKQVNEIFKTLFAKISQNINCSEEKTNKMFSACDINSDNKLSRKQFTKILQLFLEPVYL